MPFAEKGAVLAGSTTILQWRLGGGEEAGFSLRSCRDERALFESFVRGRGVTNPILDSNEGASDRDLVQGFLRGCSEITNDRFRILKSALCSMPRQKISQIFWLESTPAQYLEF